MIRRTVLLPDGATAWVLIAQREHARLSSLLSTWCAASELPAVEQAEVEWAILHHDDGWQEWDDLTSDAVARFGFSDDAAGQPRAFDEMRVEDANQIWAASIEAAARRSPFAAYLVARHFLNLRSASASSREPAAIRFASHYELFANACWEQWKSARAAALATCSLASQVPLGFPSNTPSGSVSSGPLASGLDPIAARALNRLQWADFLSLRLCGTVPPSPTVLGPSPLGPKQVLTVVGSEWLGFQAPIQYQLDPWTGPSLGRAFRLDAHLAVMRPYANVHDLKRSWKAVGILGVLERSGCES